MKKTAFYPYGKAVFSLPSGEEKTSVTQCQKDENKEQLCSSSLPLADILCIALCLYGETEKRRETEQNERRDAHKDARYTRLALPLESKRGKPNTPLPDGEGAGCHSAS